MSTTLIERDAVRILFILYFCGDAVYQQTLDDDASRNFSRVIASELKLQKIDFWVRYPDHLSWAMLKIYDTNYHLKQQSEQIKQIVRNIFNEQEPVMRRVPMHRYLHGAYESLDSILSFLQSRNLAYRQVAGSGQGNRTKYFLTFKGAQAIEGLLQECSESIWYRDRCALINSFFGRLEGEEIRELQYQEETYFTTPKREIIKHIESKVRERFKEVFGEEL